MSSFLKKIIGCLLFLQASIAIAQKSYNIKISLNGSGYDQNNLEINFNEGYRMVPLTINNENEYSTRTSALKNPVIEIFYFSPRHSPTIYRFFVKKSKCSVAVQYDSAADDISIGNIEGVVNFEKEGQDKFNLFAKKEVSELKAYEKKYNYDFSEADTGVLRQYEIYSQAVTNKSIEFIKYYPSSLYSIWMLMNEIIGKPAFSANELRSIYNRFYKSRYDKSFEGFFIIERLNEYRLNVNTKAPSYKNTFNDLNGNTYSIDSFKEKYLIISVWATWCVPCVEEIPKLKHIYSNYKNKFEMVAFSADANQTKLHDFINDQKIEWINVYDRQDLCKIYGSDLGVPQLYIIDRNGMIIYSRSKMKDYELKIFEKMVSGLGVAD